MFQTDNIYFLTIEKDLPARAIKDTSLQDGLNIIFDNGYIKTRQGIEQLGFGNLGEAITGIHLYKKIRKTERYFVVFTKRDAYVYNYKNAKFELKTRHYNSGTVTSSGTGNRTITLSNSTWDYNKYNQVELYQISFDSDKIELCNDWYKVKKIDSATQLTLLDNLPTAKTSSKYVLRLCYNSDEDDVWSVAYPYSNTDNDKIMIATNGIDEIQYFTGNGYFQNWDKYPNKAKFLGYWGSAGYEHVIFANIFDVAGQKNFEQTLEWLDAGGDFVFSGGYAELLDSSDPIVGLVPFNNRFFVYKTGNISILDINPNGGNDDPFFITQNVLEFGTPSIRTVCNTGQFHIFFTGTEIRLFDGHNTKIISENNRQFLVKIINSRYAHRSFAFIFPEEKLYCLFIPTGDSQLCDLCIAVNYETEATTFWKFLDIAGDTCYFLSRGKYSNLSVPSWGSVICYATGDTTNGSYTVTNLSNVTNIQREMLVKGNGIPDNTLVDNLSGNTLTLTKAATATATGVSLIIGWTAEQFYYRWSDLIQEEKFSRMVLGNSLGDLFMYAKEYNTDNGNNITSYWITKDFDLNQPHFDFRLLEAVLSLQIKDNQKPANLQVRFSLDFGLNWSQWQNVPLDGTDEFMQKKVYFNSIGKRVRFQFLTSSPLIFESLIIGFSANYKSMKFDR